MKVENNISKIISQPVSYQKPKINSQENLNTKTEPLDKEIKYAAGFLGGCAFAGIIMYGGRNNFAKLITKIKNKPPKTNENFPRKTDDILQQAEEVLKDKLKNKTPLDMADNMTLEEIIYYKNFVKEDLLEKLDYAIVYKYLHKKCDADLYIKTMDSYINNKINQKKCLSSGTFDAMKVLIKAYVKTNQKEKAVDICERFITNNNMDFRVDKIKQFLTDLTS